MSVSRTVLLCLRSRVPLELFPCPMSIVVSHVNSDLCAVVTSRIA